MRCARLPFGARDVARVQQRLDSVLAAASAARNMSVTYRRASTKQLVRVRFCCRRRCCNFNCMASQPAGQPDDDEQKQRTFMSIGDETRDTYCFGQQQQKLEPLPLRTHSGTCEIIAAQASNNGARLAGKRFVYVSKRGARALTNRSDDNYTRALRRNDFASHLSGGICVRSPVENSPSACE